MSVFFVENYLINLYIPILSGAERDSNIPPILPAALRLTVNRQFVTIYKGKVFHGEYAVGNKYAGNINTIEESVADYSHYYVAVDFVGDYHFFGFSDFANTRYVFFNRMKL